MEKSGEMRIWYQLTINKSYLEEDIFFSHCSAQIGIGNFVSAENVVSKNLGSEDDKKP